MARCGWVVGLIAGLVCGAVCAQAPADEPVERDVRSAPPPVAATTRARTSPATRPVRGPATRFAPSRRPRSKPTTRSVKFDLKPARVTIRLKGKQADEVFEALSKQTGAIFELSDDLWRDAAPPRVGAIEIVDKPFWPALRQVMVATGTNLSIRPPTFDANRRAPREQGIIPIGPQRGAGVVLPGIESGPALVNLEGVSRTARIDFDEPQKLTRTAQLLLRVFIEPRLHVAPLTPLFRLDAATDDRGRAIVAGPPNPQMTPRLNGLPSPSYLETPGTWRSVLSLALPAPDVARITKLTAFADFAVMTQGLEIEIPDVLNVAGSEFKLDNGVRLLIHESTTRGRQFFSIRFVAWNEGRLDPAKWDHLRRGFFSWGNRARLEAPDGQAVQANVLMSSATADAEVLDADFAFTLPPGISPEGKFKLIWTAPTAAEALSVPFELKDIPLE